MGGTFIAFLLLIFLVAVITRDSYAFVLLYLFAGGFILSRWWINRVSSAIRFERQFERRAFPGETIQVALVVRNPSLLPVLWLHVQESLPLEVSNFKILREVLSIPSKGQQVVNYQLIPKKRGYYPLGPAEFSTGDLVGLLTEKTIHSDRDYLTVYPRVIALTKISIPSQSPMGDLRHDQPIFEDPSRPMGKRDYQAGDSLRRIDWKSTAVAGRLQTKLFEPSIALETVVLLNLNTEEYHYKFRYDATELAIVVAASIANWIIAKKQSVGLIVNGNDPFSSDTKPQSFPPRKGRPHLMRLLESLARVQLAEVQPLRQVLHQKKVEFSWGTTVIVLTGQAGEDLFEEFFQIRRIGLNLVLILCGDVNALQETKARAHHFQIPFYHIQDEKDLDIWRR